MNSELSELDNEYNTYYTDSQRSSSLHTSSTSSLQRSDSLYTSSLQRSDSTTNDPSELQSGQVREESSRLETQDSENISNEKSFHVTFGDRGRESWCDKISKQCIFVNGKKRPVMHLKKNTTYHFKIENNKDHQFILTASPIGKLEEFNPVPIRRFHIDEHGNVVYEVTEDTPRVFYYQCVKHSGEGNVCLVDYLIGYRQS